MHAALPLVSIIIPVRDRAHRIRTAVASIAEQDWPVKEIVVIDDGSRDATLQTLHELAATTDVKLLVLAQANSGAAAARNAGVRAAEGEIVVFLDSDDRLLPGALTRFAKTFADDPALRTVIAGHAKNLERGRRRVRVPPPLSGDPWADFAAFLDDSRPSVAIGAIAVRRGSALARPFPENVRLGEDWVFIAVLMLAGGAKVLNEPSVEIDHRAQSLHVSPDATVDEFLRALEFAYAAAADDRRLPALRARMAADPYLRAFRHCHRIGAEAQARAAYFQAFRRAPLRCLTIGSLRKLARGLLGIRHPAAPPTTAP